MNNSPIENKIKAAHDRDRGLIDPPSTIDEYYVAAIDPQWPCDPPFPRSARPSMGDHISYDLNYEENRLKNKAKQEAYDAEDRALWAPIIESRQTILQRVRSRGAEFTSRTAEDHRLLEEYHCFHQSYDLFTDSEIEDFWLDRLKADKEKLRRYVALLEKWNGKRKVMIQYWSDLAAKIESHFWYGRDLPK